MRSIVGVVSTLALVASLCVPNDAAQATVAPPDPAGSVMCAGQHLTAGTPHAGIQSRNAQFELDVLSYGVFVTQVVYGTFETTWARNSLFFEGSKEHDHTTLAMRRDGDLVLRSSDGRRLWHTATRGTGSHNCLHVYNSGNVVMRNGGKTVWSLHSTPNLLVPGVRFAAGTRWIHRKTAPHTAPSSLVMTRGGDLRIYVGSRMAWHTATSTPGSYLRVLKSGNLVVYSPQGRRLWQAGRGKKVRTVSTWARLYCGLSVESLSRHGRLITQHPSPLPLRACDR